MHVLFNVAVIFRNSSFIQKNKQSIIIFSKTKTAKQEIIATLLYR